MPFEMNCSECGMFLDFVHVHVQEENKYKVHKVTEQVLNWSEPVLIEGGELYYDVVCPICKKLIERFEKRIDLEEWLDVYFTEKL